MENNQLRSWKQEQQRLALCRKLIMTGLYSSQEDIRREMARAGYKKISQSSISRMLKILGVMKIQNARGKRVYSLRGAGSLLSDLSGPPAAMVVSVEHNNNFILIRTTRGYSSSIARFINSYCWPEIMGVIAASNVVWITPRNTTTVSLLYQKLLLLLKERELYSDD